MNSVTALMTSHNIVNLFASSTVPPPLVEIARSVAATEATPRTCSTAAPEAGDSVAGSVAGDVDRLDAVPPFFVLALALAPPSVFWCNLWWKR
jgi:hypothetical protein